MSPSCHWWNPWKLFFCKITFLILHVKNLQLEPIKTLIYFCPLSFKLAYYMPGKIHSETIRTQVSVTIPCQINRFVLQLINSVATQSGISLPRGTEPWTDWHMSTTMREIRLNYTYCGWGLKPDVLQWDGQRWHLLLHRETKVCQTPPGLLTNILTDLMRQNFWQESKLDTKD